MLVHGRMERCGFRVNAQTNLVGYMQTKTQQYIDSIISHINKGTPLHIAASSIGIDYNLLTKIGKRHGFNFKQMLMSQIGHTDIRGAAKLFGSTYASIKNMAGEKGHAFGAIAYKGLITEDSITFLITDCESAKTSSLKNNDRYMAIATQRIRKLSAENSKLKLELELLRSKCKECW